MSKMLSFIVAICICSGVSAGGTMVETQTFNSESAATAAGWTGNGNQDIGNNFGFSSSNNAGGVSGSGEAGGLMLRSGNVSYYADTTIKSPAGQSMSMNDAISFSGAFAYTANGAGYVTSGFEWNLAYFDNSKLGSGDPRKNSYAGFAVNERNASTVRLGLTLNSTNGTGLASVTGSGPDVVSNQIVLDKTTQYTFNWVYDPSAGANGVVTLTFYDASRPLGQTLRGTMIGDLSATQRSEGAIFNTYGITNEFWGGAGNTADNTLTAFVDNLSYSVAPEPSGLAMVFLAVGLLTRRRHRNV